MQIEISFDKNEFCPLFIREEKHEEISKTGKGEKSDYDIIPYHA